MNTLISKSFDALINKVGKLPDILILILFFCSFFTKQAKGISTLLSSKLNQLMPESLINTLDKLQISYEQLINLWEALLVFMLLVFIWDILKFYAETPYDVVIELSGEILIFLNSVIFIFALIHNKLSETSNKISVNFLANGLDSPFHFFVAISFAIFLILFAFVYLSPLIMLFTTIRESNCKIRYKIFWYLVYFFILGKILTAIGIEKFVR